MPAKPTKRKKQRKKRKPPWIRIGTRRYRKLPIEDEIKKTKRFFKAMTEAQGKEFKDFKYDPEEWKRFRIEMEAKNIFYGLNYRDPRYLETMRALRSEIRRVKKAVEAGEEYVLPSEAVDNLEFGKFARIALASLAPAKQYLQILQGMLAETRKEYYKDMKSIQRSMRLAIRRGYEKEVRKRIKELEKEHGLRA